MSNKNAQIRWPSSGLPFFRVQQSPKGWTIRLYTNPRAGQFIRTTKLGFAPVKSDRPRYVKNKAKALLVASRYEAWLVAHRIGR